MNNDLNVISMILADSIQQYNPVIVYDYFIKENN